MGKRKEASRRTETKRETAWRCRNIAASTWRLQTCSPGTEAVLPPSFITTLSLHFFSFLHFLPVFISYSLSLPPQTLLLMLCFFPQLNYTQRCSPLLQCVLFSCPQTDSSWLLRRRKFSHVFLIKAPHRSPVVASPATAFKMPRLAYTR